MSATVVYGILAGDSDVTAITTNIVPIQSAQDSGYPMIAFKGVDVTPHPTHSGTSNVDVFNVDVHYITQDYMDTEDLANKGRTALDRYRGTVGSWTVNQINFMSRVDGFSEIAEAEAYEMIDRYEVRIMLAT